MTGRHHRGTPPERASESSVCQSSVPAGRTLGPFITEISSAVKAVSLSSDICKRGMKSMTLKKVPAR
jgi:hypothetical protein